MSKAYRARNDVHSLRVGYVGTMRSTYDGRPGCEVYESSEGAGTEDDLEDSASAPREEISMIPINELTEAFLAESLERHLPSEETPEYQAMIAKIHEMRAWEGPQRLAATLCVLHGRTLRVSDIVTLGVIVGMKIGWNAVQDLVEQRRVCDEMSYLMSDQEMESLRKEIGRK